MTIVKEGRRPVGYRPGAGSKASRAVNFAVLCALSILFLIPFYLIVRNALASDAEITAPGWMWFPPELHWENFQTLFDNPAVPMARSLLNSAIIAIATTVGTLFLCSTAGYGLARIPYKHVNKVFYAILATLMIPSAITFLPSFVMVSSLGWVSDYRGLIIPTLFNAFVAFLCRQYFLSFPKELEEAARVDGLSYWGAYWRIVVPNSKGFMAAIAVITFVGSWNAFLWPLVIGRDPESWTVQVALSTFMTAQTVSLNQLFLAAAVAILPLVFVFLFLQRFLVQGVAQTGLKG
ncbi:carbohydrate ABC transporter permease [Glycomyces buryatensis]|uniref:Carbohydrate ABC transporter permease n=1 Tax=Glycomyces buryatensis TaxID=2570927 RepID=A0A4S8PZ55_9ACTN|nr:carbohydrate ABC transporter permease [Glycomyces buryatensis]THV33539.1 carbohydrate ABC transporter permease [Glycomyces buryatensis]